MTTLPIDQEELGEIKDEIGKEDKVIAEGPVQFLHHGTSLDLYNYLVAPSASTAASPEQSISFMRATIPLDDLELEISSLTRNRPIVQKVTTDDKLVDALFRELCLRIPALNSKKNDKKKAPRVVVFTESDTIYSKAIVCELEQQLEQTNARLEVYSYLQALDGRPEEARAPASPSGSKPPDIATLLLQGSAISETSFGTSQFDYLRRAALDLKAARNQNVVAVGILGSDIYDKMLVLQAVRPVLPAAVFFTTDLDALYLERSMEPFTRNLVVASADDLGANESDDATTNWKLPPMRDSYQTVLVKEVRRILRGDASEKSGSAYIFEIAAGRPIDLTTAGGTSWPLWWLAQDWFNPLIFVLALANAILILCAVTTRNKENCPPGAMKKWAKWLVYGETMLAGFCIIILLLILILWNPIVGKLDSVFGLNLSCLDVLGEPLTLGVSIWPSIMIRLLAFGVAILLLSLASRSFVVHGLTQKEDLGKALGGTIRFKGRAKKGGKVVGFEHFFQQLFEWKHVRWRIVIFSIVYLGVSFLLFMIWPPTVPGRGGSALLIEKIVLALGVALYIVHLIFCLVLHWHALRLLYGIGSHFESEHERTRARPAGAQQGGDPINLEQMLTCLGTLTMVIGKTLLYPLTVLILIILSRLDIFDNWVMTPSLTITFALGAIVLVAASLILWLEGARLKRLVMAQRKGPAKLKLEAVSDGVFAAWYNQPIFSAILSALAVFGSLSVAGPLTRLFFAS